MNFAEAMRETSTHTFTENGAQAKNTSGDKLVDFYATIGALRNADDARVTRLFDDAYAEDPLLATKILFYARDIRGGLGERKIFRTLLKHAAMYHPEAVKPNLVLIGTYGRCDDLYSLIETPLENDMWLTMKHQFKEDLLNLQQDKSVSLLAKWIKTPDTSSAESRKLGCLTAKKLGYSVYDFKRLLRKLRKQIRVTETFMSAQKWDEIVYPEVPSKAMNNYRKAFKKHDEERFNEFTQKALKGEVKINSSTLYPYDLVEKYKKYNGWGNIFVDTEDPTVEAQWRQLPNYVQEGSHAIVMADTSGSMYGRPMDTALGLAIYFAERNVGPYKDVFMTFSMKPTFQAIKGQTLLQKLKNLNTEGWSSNTNLKAAFNYVLDTAIKNEVSPDDMPKAIIVVSDMEIDACETNKSWSFYETVKAQYEINGYQIPTVIFWNVDSRHDVFHADSNRKGVQLVSGQSTAVFKQLMENIGCTAYEAMLRVLNNERYDAIQVKRPDKRNLSM